MLDFIRNRVMDEDLWPEAPCTGPPCLCFSCPEGYDPGDAGAGRSSPGDVNVDVEVEVKTPKLKSFKMPTGNSFQTPSGKIPKVVANTAAKTHSTSMGAFDRRISILAEKLTTKAHEDRDLRPRCHVHNLDSEEQLFADMALATVAERQLVAAVCCISLIIDGHMDKKKRQLYVTLTEKFELPYRWGLLREVQKDFFRGKAVPAEMVMVLVEAAAGTLPDVEAQWRVVRWGKKLLGKLIC
jgi:hypothetical protein